MSGPILNYLRNILQRIWRWKNRTVSGDEEWEIPLPFGIERFERSLEENVTMVELSTLTSLDSSILDQGIFCNLDEDRIALLVKAEKIWPLLFFQFWWSRERFFVFYGRFETDETGLRIHGTYGTDSLFRWHKVLLTSFLDIGMAISGLAALLYPIIVIQESLKTSPLENALLLALIMIAAYPFALLVIFLWNVAMVYFSRLLVELTGMGRLGRPVNLYWFLLHCAGWDQSSSSKPD